MTKLICNYATFPDKSMKTILVKIFNKGTFTGDKRNLGKTMKNVLLIGIGGVYNYGCEAIIRGTVSILKSINPEITVSYASYNYEDEYKTFKRLQIFISLSSQRPRQMEF